MRILKRDLLLLVLIILVIIVLVKQFNSNSERPLMWIYRGRREILFEDLTIKIVGADDMQGIERRKAAYGESACNLPQLGINGSEIMKYYQEPKPITCSTEKNWVYLDRGYFAFIPERDTAECSITYFDRLDDKTNKYDQPVPLIQGEKMTGNYGKVNCAQNKEFWKGLLMTTVRDEELIKGLNEKASKRPSSPRLDVIIISFDSMSRLQFFRKMPETMKQLEQMGAVTMNGYNIVGDGTPQAFIPILTGKNEMELPNTRKTYEAAKWVDVAYPLVWQNFSDAGYVTLYGEDAFTFGTFTYRLKGFSKQPTDHFLYPFYAQAGGDCIGSEESHTAWFRVIKDFLLSYNDVGKFLLMHHSGLSHNDVNRIAVSLCADLFHFFQLADIEFTALLESLVSQQLLDNSILIVMSDHGPRFSKIRDTHQGQLEERLPLFSFVLPKEFKESSLGKKIHKNLMDNRDVLTSPYDVHATLLDVIQMPSGVDTIQDTKDRSLSMFRPIPSTRTCSQAGIEPHWCTCLKWKDATISEGINTELFGRAVAVAINAQLSEVKKLCATVTWKETLSAKKLSPHNDVLHYHGPSDLDGYVPRLNRTTQISFAHFQLKIVALPNNAIFEATVFFNYKTRELEVDLMSISHVSPYGSDPHCIINDHYALAQFCVCHDKVRT